jgi:RsiW-degrading membrane proteinase PrsW (M82 family)
MSVVNRWLASLLSSSIDILETEKRRRLLLLVTLAGILVTIGLWWIHLSSPGLFDKVSNNIFSMAVISAPPFLAALSFGHLMLPELKEGNEYESGPMSGYLYREKSNKRWKIVIAAVMIGALNYILMLLTSRPEQ